MRMRGAGSTLGEFEIIARYLAPLATDPGAFDLQDDAAVLSTPGQALVVTTDTIVAGVHFFPDDPPGSIGHKALAVNLSDLAAKAAEPRAYLLTLALPAAPADAWMAAFTEGLGALQREAGIALIGGDTVRTPGPLAISVTAIGDLPAAGAILRSGARPGDRLYVTGTIGDGHLGLRLLLEPDLARRWDLTGDEAAFLIDRYRRPRPRLAAAGALRLARAAIDISDGLTGDLAKLCRASRVGAEIALGRAPLSEPARKALNADRTLLTAMLTGGDDYEILAALPFEKAYEFERKLVDARLGCEQIGEILESNAGLGAVGPDGEKVLLEDASFDHFLRPEN